MTEKTPVVQPVNGEPSAPRLTLSDLKKKIKEVRYTRIAGTTTTVCNLILENGFVVTGTSASVSEANFDEQIGQNIAFDNALDEVWKLEGYLLRERLYQQSKPVKERLIDELTEESLRLGRLSKLLSGERPIKLSTIQWALLHGQQAAMTKKVMILQKRIEVMEADE